MTGRELLIGLAMVLLLEGSAYALFPKAMRDAMKQVLGMPVEALRLVGLLAVTIGAALYWLAGRG